MKLIKQLLILSLPLLLFSNDVMASSKDVKQYLKRQAEEKKRAKMKASKEDPNQQALEDLKLLSAELHNYYNIEDYPAGSENESKKYTSLRDLLTDFSFTNIQTQMGEEEEQEKAKEKLKKIIISAKKFRAGENNADIRSLAKMLKANEKYKRDRTLKAFCIKVEDYERVKEELGVTDADMDLYSSEIKANGKSYEVRALFPQNCFP